MVLGLLGIPPHHLLHVQEDLSLNSVGQSGYTSVKNNMLLLLPSYLKIVKLVAKLQITLALKMPDTMSLSTDQNNEASCTFGT